MATKPKALKLMNGRGGSLLNFDDPVVGKRWRDLPHNGYCHGYIAAHSRADAARMIAEYLGSQPRGIEGELRDYWSHGAWGTSMDGITPDRGIWIQFGMQGRPVRVFPLNHPDSYTQTEADLKPGDYFLIHGAYRGTVAFQFGEMETRERGCFIGVTRLWDGSAYDLFHMNPEQKIRIVSCEEAMASVAATRKAFA